jgi:hypothetical protein
MTRCALLTTIGAGIALQPPGLAQDSPISSERTPYSTPHYIFIGGSLHQLTLHTGYSPMDSRRTRMATHYVRPRRACPAPVGQLTPSRRGVVSSRTTAQAERTHSNSAHAFPQASDLAWNSAKHDWSGKVQVSYQTMLVHWREGGKETGLQPSYASPHALKSGGLRRATVRCPSVFRLAAQSV